MSDVISFDETGVFDPGLIEAVAKIGRAAKNNLMIEKLCAAGIDIDVARDLVMNAAGYSKRMDLTETKYEYAVKTSRWRTTGNGLSTCPRLLRRLAANNSVWQMDIRSSTPSIVVALAVARNVQCPHLKAYVTDRVAYLKRFGYQYNAQNKELILMLINNFNSNYNDFGFKRQIKNEVKAIFNVYIQDPDYKHLYDEALAAHGDNELSKVERSFMSRVVSSVELRVVCDMLTTAYSHNSVVRPVGICGDAVYYVVLDETRHCSFVESVSTLKFVISGTTAHISHSKVRSDDDSTYALRRACVDLASQLPIVAGDFDFRVLPADHKCVINHDQFRCEPASGQEWFRSDLYLDGKRQVVATDGAIGSGKTFQSLEVEFFTHVMNLFAYRNNTTEKQLTIWFTIRNRQCKDLCGRMSTQLAEVAFKALFGAAAVNAKYTDTDIYANFFRDVSVGTDLSDYRVLFGDGVGTFASHYERLVAAEGTASSQISELDFVMDDNCTQAILLALTDAFSSDAFVDRVAYGCNHSVKAKYVSWIRSVSPREFRLPVIMSYEDASRFIKNAKGRNAPDIVLIQQESGYRLEGVEDRIGMVVMDEVCGSVNQAVCVTTNKNKFTSNQRAFMDVLKCARRVFIGDGLLEVDPTASTFMRDVFAESIENNTLTVHHFDRASDDSVHGKAMVRKILVLSEGAAADFKAAVKKLLVQLAHKDVKEQDGFVFGAYRYLRAMEEFAGDIKEALKDMSPDVYETRFVSIHGKDSSDNQRILNDINNNITKNGIIGLCSTSAITVGVDIRNKCIVCFIDATSFNGSDSNMFGPLPRDLNQLMGRPRNVPSKIIYAFGLDVAEVKAALADPDFKERYEAKFSKECIRIYDDIKTGVINTLRGISDRNEATGSKLFNDNYKSPHAWSTMATAVNETYKRSSYKFTQCFIYQMLCSGCEIEIIDSFDQIKDLDPYLYKVGMSPEELPGEQGGDEDEPVECEVEDEPRAEAVDSKADELPLVEAAAEEMDCDADDERNPGSKKWNKAVATEMGALTMLRKKIKNEIEGCDDEMAARYLYLYCDRLCTLIAEVSECLSNVSAIDADIQDAYCVKVKSVLTDVFGLSFGGDYVNTRKKTFDGVTLENVCELFDVKTMVDGKSSVEPIVDGKGGGAEVSVMVDGKEVVQHTLAEGKYELLTDSTFDRLAVAPKIVSVVADRDATGDQHVRDRDYNKFCAVRYAAMICTKAPHMYECEGNNAYVTYRDMFHSDPMPGHLRERLHVWLDIMIKNKGLKAGVVRSNDARMLVKLSKDEIFRGANPKQDNNSKLAMLLNLISVIYNPARLDDARMDTSQFRKSQMTQKRPLCDLVEINYDVICNRVFDICTHDHDFERMINRIFRLRGLVSEFGRHRKLPKPPATLKKAILQFNRASKTISAEYGVSLVIDSECKATFRKLDGLDAVMRSYIDAYAAGVIHNQITKKNIVPDTHDDGKDNSNSFVALFPDLDSVKRAIYDEQFPLIPQPVVHGADDSGANQCLSAFDVLMAAGSTNTEVTDDESSGRAKKRKRKQATAAAKERKQKRKPAAAKEKV